MCLGWMDYCFRFFLICPFPPPPCHGSSQAPSYVIVDWVSLQGGLWTGSWLCPSTPSSKFSPPVAGHWLVFFFFFGEGSLDIKLIIKPVRLCPTFSTLPFILNDLGISSIPMVQYVLRLDKIGSPSYFTLLLPHFRTCSEEHSVLITSLFCFLYLIIIFY